MKPLFSMIFLLAALFILPQHAAAQHQMPNSLLGNGGATSSNSNFQMQCAIGEPAIGESSNASFALQAGFLYTATAGVTVDVDEEAHVEMPQVYALHGNFPNPFNPATTIRYDLPKPERVMLKIYNLIGEEVATLVNDEPQAAGYHAAIWDGRDKNGRVVASGVYVYRMQAGSFVMTRKLALIK
jgi:hypothetical protein